MKKLVYAAVVASAFAASACVVEEDPVIYATVTLSSAGGGPITFQPGDGIRINARLAGTSSGFSDVFNPGDTRVFTDPLTTGPGLYVFWVDYINDRGSDNPADWVVVDATDESREEQVDGDVELVADLVLHNGFLMTNWSLSDAGGAPIASCADIPGQDGVSVLSTLAGTSQATDDIYNCEDGFNNPNPVVTAPIEIGDYTVSVSIIDTAGAALGEAPPESPRLQDGNDYQTLNAAGIVDIQLFP
jgi:hypothetical protein